MENDDSDGSEDESDDYEASDNEAGVKEASDSSASDKKDGNKEAGDNRGGDNDEPLPKWGNSNELELNAKLAIFIHTFVLFSSFKCFLALIMLENFNTFCNNTET